MITTTILLLSALAQAPTDDLRSAQRARALLDEAVTAHGGEARLRALKDVSLRFRGQRWMSYQSFALRPWVTQKTEADIVLDYANNRAYRYSASRYPVDFVFAGTQVITPQGGFFYDPTRAGYGDAVLRFPGQAVVNHPWNRELPALQLLIARNRPETLRWVGERDRLQGVTYAEPNGAVYTLWIDPATKRLVRLEWLRDDAVAGDQLASFTYSGYRMESGVPVPSRLVERRNGEVIRDDTMTIAIDRGVDQKLFTPPTTGYTEAQAGPPSGPEAEPIRKLGENVWLIQNLGNRVMFVAFRDYVLVFEAPTPQSAATAVMDAVRRTVPGKPIRYVTFSHHHDDHAGGLRPYIAEGITIVTTPRNRAFVNEVATVKHVLRPDALSTNPKQPVLETFSGKRVFTDGTMTVELYEVPNTHVDEMVMAYIPSEKLIFQGDMLIAPERGQVGPANTLTREFLAAIDKLRLDVVTIAGVHGPVVKIQDLRRAVSLAGK